MGALMLKRKNSRFTSLFMIQYREFSSKPESKDKVLNSFPSKNEISFFRVSGFYNRDLWQGTTELTNPTFKF